MTEWHSYEPASGHRLPHDPLNAIVAPRPIGWVSTLSADGVPNLAPYSFFNLFNYSPPLIGFSSMGWKDSVANITATGEFVWNLVSRDLGEAMNTTAATPFTTADRAFFMALVACTGSPVVIPSAPTSRMPWAAPK